MTPKVALQIPKSIIELQEFSKLIHESQLKTLLQILETAASKAGIFLFLQPFIPTFWLLSPIFPFNV